MIIKKFDIQTEKETKNQRLAIVSDIHIDDYSGDQKSLEVIGQLDKIQPTSILIPGDLYNHSGTINEYIKRFINTAAEIADVFYVPGNSELKSGFIPFALYSNKNPRVHVLGGFFSQKPICHVENFGGMSIAGLELNADFYQHSEDTRVELLLNKYKEYIERLTVLCQDKDFNVLLCHDPIIIKVAQELAELSKFDLVVSGHNHGGIAPRSLRPLFKVLGADLEKLYPTYTKGMHEVGNTNFVVSEGITRYHSEFGPLKVLEEFHEGTIEVVRVRKKDN